MQYSASRFLGLLATLWWCCAAAAAHAQEAPAGDSLLHIVRALADRGVLDEPATVGETLGMHFLSAPTSLAHQEACSDDVRPSTIETHKSDYLPVSNNWFLRQPGGGDVNFPGWLVGGTLRTSEPALTYRVERAEVCYRGHSRTTSEADATIEFVNVPGFACITSDELREAIPGVTQWGGTDGVLPWEYRGRVTEDTGVVVTFSYVFPQKCLLDIRIEQGARNGRRFMSAIRKLNACHDAAHAKLHVDPRTLLAWPPDDCGAWWEYLPGGSHG